MTRRAFVGIADENGKPIAEQDFEVERLGIGSHFVRRAEIGGLEPGVRVRFFGIGWRSGRLHWHQAYAVEPISQARCYVVLNCPVKGRPNLRAIQRAVREEKAR